MMNRLQTVVFDLDDTLYKELEYLQSAYKEIAIFLESKIGVSHLEILQEMLDWYQNGENAFKLVLEKYETAYLETDLLLKMYRNHVPSIKLSNEGKHVLNSLKELGISMGIMTDGRSIQQRNKIKVLELENYTKDILISEEFGSEKPDERNYQHFMKKYPTANYFYIGDNTKKDFVTANKLGWTTICLLDNGSNVHQQNFTLPKAYLPKHKIHSLTEILDLL
ncbi:HAD-IA family hydrolase [Ascidiimonas sp. W6]|uniref:HAD family hydrolase n=1 Tax=Ascidiimonas meishanensis TaxID=3128903 RepID=UPI0030ED0DA1